MSSTRLTVSGIGSWTSPKTNICKEDYKHMYLDIFRKKTIWDISWVYLYSLVTILKLLVSPSFLLVDMESDEDCDEDCDELTWIETPPWNI